METLAFIKNYEKDGKVTQMLTIKVVSETEGTTYTKYFVNVSKKNGHVYLSECKD